MEEKDLIQNDKLKIIKLIIEDVTNNKYKFQQTTETHYI